MSSAYAYLMKFIIVGDTSVGKSCLLYHFTQNRFNPVHDVTIGAEYGSKIITVDDKPIKLQIWDTAGQEKFRSITRSYYRGAAGALLVYDVTKRKTFEHLTSWLQDIKQEGDPRLTVMIVGNKCDVEEHRNVSTEEGKEFAKNNNCMFTEASALTGLNVEAAFGITVEGIYDKLEDWNFELLDETKGIKIGNWKDNSISSETRTIEYDKITTSKQLKCCS